MAFVNTTKVRIQHTAGIASDMLTLLQPDDARWNTADHNDTAVYDKGGNVLTNAFIKVQKDIAAGNSWAGDPTVNPFYVTSSAAHTAIA
jgi:hypothetical protein